MSARRRRTPGRARLTLVAALVLAITAIAPNASAAGPSSAQLLNAAAKEHGVAAGKLKLGERSELNLELTGISLTTAKVYNAATGKAYLVALDANGQSVDLAKAQAAEQAARDRLYGKLDPRLYDQLQSLGPNEKIAVSVWLNVATPPGERSTARGLSIQEARAAVNSRLGDVQAYMAPKRQGVLAALAQMGADAKAPAYGPAVFATLNKGQIQKLARRADVSTLYGPAEYTLHSDDGATTVRGHINWANAAKGQGVSSRPVVHEPDGVADYNPFLNNNDHPVMFWCANAACGGKDIDNHATEVAGMIASTHPLYRGIAPSVQTILSANSQDFSDANLVNAYEWGRGNGGDPTNMSWGTICGGFQTFMSRYVDWAHNNLFSTFTISSGNQHPDCTNATDNDQVSAPGLAYGAITVGAHSDGDDGFWNNDVISGFSKWINPDFAPGLEKPEIAAVGEGLITTDAAGGDHLSGNIAGTSFSSPQTAGIVNVMLGRQPGQNVWPETNRATILASAYHDVNAGPSRDGVGSPVANNAERTYALGRFINDCAVRCVPADFPRTYNDVMTLPVGQVVRVATSWDSMTDGSTFDQTGADLDFNVKRPDGSVIASSVQIDETWEMVQFTADQAGAYDVQVTHFSSVAGWPGTFLGTAWSFRNLPTFCSSALVTPPNVTRTINTANGPTFFDGYPGWGSGVQNGREGVRKLTLGTTRDITVTDTHADIDLHIIGIPNCNADPIVPVVFGQGLNVASVDNAPAGTYYIVYDGFNGTVGTTTSTITVSGP